MTTVKETLKWIYERPARALKIYYGGGRKDAITEMCISCVGTSQEAGKCQCLECPLWTFRPGASKGAWDEATQSFKPCDIPSFVPPKEQLQQLAEANVSDAVREHARKLGNSRKGIDTDEE
jgi:hypothetical protein